MTKPVRRIVCAVSGGVDSTVAALYLKKRGFDVVGVFMRNWNVRDEFGQCLADQEAEHAEFACKKLNIPFHEVSLEQDYWTDVFEPLVDAYRNGLTPNPDVLCNRHVKFGSFLQKLKSNSHATSRTNLGDFDAIATGHYAASSFGDYLQYRSNDARHKCRLLIPRDVFKDQTLFLSQIDQSALRQTCFPLSNLLKADVKRIAIEAGFVEIATKKESTGICFIGNRRFSNFMREYIDTRTGRFILYDTGEVVGQHDGIHLYTHGQRTLLGGRKCPYFVVYKDVKSGDAVVVDNHEHEMLYSRRLWISAKSLHWISGTQPWGSSFQSSVRGESINRSFSNSKIVTLSTQCDPKPRCGPLNHSSRSSAVEGLLTDQLDPDKGFRCGFRFQHTHQIVRCTIYPHRRRLKVQYSWPAVFGSSTLRNSPTYETHDEDGMEVVLDRPYFSLTPGQYAVFYNDSQANVRGITGTECLGSAVIAETEATVTLRNFLRAFEETSTKYAPDVEEQMMYNTV